MSEKTLKLEGWAPQAKPSEDNDMTYHRQLIVEIVYGLWFRKKEILANMGMPPQPISLLEIYREYQSRLAMLQSIKEWRCKIHGKRWLDRRVNECFKGDTLVQMVDGSTKKIQDIEKGEIVIGQMNGMSIGSEVLAHHKIFYEGKLVELTLNNHKKLICTPDHLCLTANGWIEASRVTHHTVLVSRRKSNITKIMAQTQQERINEYFTQPNMECNQITCAKDWSETNNTMGQILCTSIRKNEGKNQTNKDREGIPSRNYRWRGNNINFTTLRKEEKQTFYVRAQTTDFNNLTRIMCLAKQKIKEHPIETFKKSTKPKMENSLCLSSSRLFNGANFAGNTSVPYNQKETGYASAKILRLPQISLRKGVLSGRNRTCRTDSQFEPAWLLAKRFLRFKGIIYDLTTTTENYIANSILVHNCACPKYYPNGVPKIVAKTSGKYEPNPQIFKT